MTTGLERLDAIRLRQLELFPDPWQRAPFMPTYSGEILAFDQSLGHTGWVLLCPVHPYVVAAGMIVTETDMGHEGNLSRTVEIHSTVRSLIELRTLTKTLVVHESPPAGDAMFRPESSLLAAAAIRIAAFEARRPVHMVAAQRAKKRMCGKPNATKTDVKAALSLFWPHLPIRRPWNEHIIDATILGIVAYEEYS